MANKSDKSVVTKLFIACILAIAIFHIAWFGHFIDNFLNLAFLIPYLALWVFFLLSVKAAYKNINTAKDNLTKWFVIGACVIMLIWLGGWGAGSNEKDGVQEYIQEHATYGGNN